MAGTLDLEALLPILAQLCASRTQRRSLVELAREAGRSRSSFQRAFSRIVGESPKQYTRRLQLECAAVLLTTTEASVLDVALQVGFDSHEGFTRAFVAHFGRPPKDFRAHAEACGLADQLRHAEIVTHVGPCLRLFRAPLSNSSNSSNSSNHPARAMNYDIITRPIEATTFLYKAARCEHTAIAKTLAELLPAVFQYATAEGIQMLGPPTTVYVKWGPGMATLWAGFPVAVGTEGKGDIEVAVLPAGEAAVTIHTGPYDGLSDAHAAVEVYLGEIGRTPGGPLREVYLTDPGEVPDPQQWKTQILWPLADAGSGS